VEGNFLIKTSKTPLKRGVFDSTSLIHLCLIIPRKPAGIKGIKTELIIIERELREAKYMPSKVAWGSIKAFKVLGGNGMNYQEKINAIAGLLKRTSKALVFTGAGVSTESGIPDYRSSDKGLWHKLDPMRTASVSAMLRDPGAFYDNNLARWASFRQAEPNQTHRAIAALENMGLILGVITQNIDSLHLKAGSRRVWEVHGHLRTCRCLSCHSHVPFECLLEQYDAKINPPLCQICGGILRPDVVLFEDAMGKEYAAALQAMHGCGLLLVAGSSLQVYPAAGLPELSAQVVIINREPTPWDSRAAVVVHETAGLVFADLLQAIKA
jgi:NAD-dependent deacetylase